MQISACLSAAAAKQFVLLRDDDASFECRERGIRWLKESPAHVAELMRLGHMHHVLRNLNADSHVSSLDFFADMRQAHEH